MPTPGDVQHMSSSPAADDQGYQSERRRFYRVRSASDIDWNNLLEEQLEPNLKGGPDASKSFDDLCMLRRQVPNMDNRTFQHDLPQRQCHPCCAEEHMVCMRS